MIINGHAAAGVLASHRYSAGKGMNAAFGVEYREIIRIILGTCTHELGHKRRFSLKTVSRHNNGLAPPTDDACVEKDILGGHLTHGDAHKRVKKLDELKSRSPGCKADAIPRYRKVTSARRRRKFEQRIGPAASYVLEIAEQRAFRRLCGLSDQPGIIAGDLDSNAV